MVVCLEFAADWFHVKTTCIRAIRHPASFFRSLSIIYPSLLPEQTRSRLLRLLRKNETPWHYTMSPLMARVALRQGGAFAAGSCVLLALCGVSYVVHRMVDTGGEIHG